MEKLSKEWFLFQIYNWSVHWWTSPGYKDYRIDANMVDDLAERLMASIAEGTTSRPDLVSFDIEKLEETNKSCGGVVRHALNRGEASQSQKNPNEVILNETVDEAGVHGGVFSSTSLANQPAVNVAIRGVSKREHVLEPCDQTVQCIICLHVEWMGDSLADECPGPPAEQETIVQDKLPDYRAMLCAAGASQEQIGRLAPKSTVQTKERGLNVNWDKFNLKHSLEVLRETRNRLMVALEGEPGPYEQKLLESIDELLDEKRVQDAPANLCYSTGCINPAMCLCECHKEQSAQDPNVCEHGTNTVLSGICNRCVDGATAQESKESVAPQGAQAGGHAAVAALSEEPIPSVRSESEPARCGGDLPTPCSCDESPGRCPAHSVKEKQAGEATRDCDCCHGTGRIIYEAGGPEHACGNCTLGCDLQRSGVLRFRDDEESEPVCDHSFKASKFGSHTSIACNKCGEKR